MKGQRGLVDPRGEQAGRLPTVLLGVCCLPLLLGGCGAAATSEATPGEVLPLPWFEDVTAASGLDFVHEAGPTGSYFMPQVIGSGAALFDYDNDGRLDVYFLQNGGPQSRATNRLFHQEPDGRFRDVS